MLERIQKYSLKVNLKEYYKDYKNVLKMLNMQTLYDRRDRKCVTFAKKCLNEVNLCKKIMQKSWMMSKSLCAVPTTYASAVVEAIISLN